jgi:hypothetical protein
MRTEDHMRNTRAFYGTVCALCAAGAMCPAAPGKVRITEIEVSPASVQLGDAFSLRVKAVGTGVDVLNFRIRTPYTAGVGDVPDGFTREKGAGYAVFQAEPGGHVLDNGVADRDPAAGVLRVNLSTKGLRDGPHYLTVFAHNRPGSASHAKDHRDLELTVKGGRVEIVALQRGEGGPTEPVVFELPGKTLAPGELLVCGVRSRNPGDRLPGVRLHSPYTWGEKEVLHGFQYNAKAKVGFVSDGEGELIRDNGPLDRDPAESSVRLEIPTRNWPSGVHVLTLTVPTLEIRRPYGGTTEVYRDFSVKIPGPDDHLELEVGDPVYVGEGTHFSNLVYLGNGRVVCDTHASNDDGKTWEPLATPIPRPNLMPDGSIAGTVYRAYPVEGKDGEYRGKLLRSTDGGRTISTAIETRVLIPLARAALGHGHHVGPLFGRSLVALPSGEWLSSMYGWFKGDTEPDRYRKGGTMRRSYIGLSRDKGKTWEYLSTVAYRPFLGNEGYSELVIRLLPRGDILAVVRTGGNSNAGWQDNPLMVSWSHDGGRTWTPVQRTGAEGVWPDVTVLDDGLLACSTGRPGAFIMFSADRGATWTDHTPIDAERYSGYTSVTQLEPGKLLVGYGVRSGFDPAIGGRRHGLYVVPVRYAEREE